MNIDHTHKNWALAALVLALLATAVYCLTAIDAGAGDRPRLLFGIAGTSLMAFAGLLPFAKKLAHWRILKLQTIQKGHIWLGTLALPLILFHGGFRMGGFLSSALVIVVFAIAFSGVAGLLFQHLLPLCKAGKEGKSKLAANIIASGYKLTLHMHVPLAVSLLVLVLTHAVMSLFF
jgi:hypothetical protein